MKVSNFALHSQGEHHKGSTLLKKIGIGLVSNVPLDYMTGVKLAPQIKKIKVLTRVPFAQLKVL